MQRILPVIFGLILATPAYAQLRQVQSISTDTKEEEPPPLESLQPLPVGPAQAGRVANSVVGEVGQRQTGDQTPGISPVARITGRIQNRIQSRIRNRIDRNYDTQANTTSPFKVAEAETRTVGRHKR